MIRRSGAFFLILSAASGCTYTSVHAECPSCVVFDRFTGPAPIENGARVVFVLVPGLLGFAWEWDEPLVLLRAAPETALQVFEWSPRQSLQNAAGDFVRRMNELLAALPSSVERVVVVGHSAGGLVTARGAGGLRVPPGRTLEIINVGVPYAGMHRMIADTGADFWNAPSAIAIGADLSNYPAPAPRVAVTSYDTSWPDDPVMQPIAGHRPDDPRVGPPGGRRVRAAPGTDHNKYLGEVVREALGRLGLLRPRN